MKPFNQNDYCMTLIEEVPKRNNRRYATFLCDCGNTITTRMDSVKSGKTQSCGCLVKLNGKTRKSHTDELVISSYSRLYNIYNKMKDRCTNPDHKHYSYYGGRGIVICNEWLADSNNFFQWALVSGYDNTLTLDRRDFNGNYSPDNCHWKTRSFQSQNTRLLSVRNNTGYRGVSRNRKGSTIPFRARIGYEGKQYMLGTYLTELEAAKAFDAWVTIHGTHHTKNGVDLCNTVKTFGKK